MHTFNHHPLQKKATAYGHRLDQSAHVSLGANLTIREALYEGYQLPNGRSAYQDIDQASQCGVLSAEYCCNKVKLEQANKAPVQASYDNQKQCDDVQCVHFEFLQVSGRTPTLVGALRSAGGISKRAA